MLQQVHRFARTKQPFLLRSLAVQGHSTKSECTHCLMECGQHSLDNHTDHGYEGIDRRAITITCVKVLHKLYQKLVEVISCSDTKASVLVSYITRPRPNWCRWQDFPFGTLTIFSLKLCLDQLRCFLALIVVCCCCDFSITAS